MNVELRVLNYISSFSHFTFHISHSGLTYSLVTPQFAPNIYDFISMLKSDKIIYLDTVSWSRKGRTHRTFITNGEDEIWLRVPVLTDDKKKAIKDVRIDHSEKWVSNFWKALETVFSKEVYFDHFEWEIKALLDDASKFEKLIDWNLFFFQKICSFLELEIDSDFQSNIGFPNRSFYFESDSKNYLPQPNEILAHAEKIKHFENHHSMLHLLFAFGPEFFNISDSIKGMK